MSDLDDCTIEELDELIRVVVLTNPWSTVQKFPDLKKIHVIRSEGFANAKGDPIKKVAPKGDLTEDELFELKQTEMREKGMRLISGAEYKICLGVKNRPSVIPIWMPFGKTFLPSTDIINPSAPPLSCDGKDDNVPIRSIASSKEADDHRSDSKELQLVSDSCSGYMLSEVSHSPQYSDDEVMTTTSTVSPNPKKVRGGTHGNCMDEDTEASNALTVEWAKPFIGEVQDWRGSTIKRA